MKTKIMKQLMKLMVGVIMSLSFVQLIDAMNRKGKPSRGSNNHSGLPAVNQRRSSQSTNVQPHINLELTKEEQEAIDADIAFSLMQKDFEESGIDPAARVRAEVSDAEFARQLLVDEWAQDNSSLGPVNVTIRPEPRPSAIMPARPVPSNVSRTIDYQVDHVVNYINSSLQSGRNLVNLLIRVDQTYDARTLYKKIAQRCNLEFFETSISYDCSIQSATAQMTNLVNYIKDHSLGKHNPLTKGMVILDMRHVRRATAEDNEYIATKYRNVREIIRSSLGWLINRCMMLVIIVNKDEPLIDVLKARAQRGTDEGLHIIEEPGLSPVVNQNDDAQVGASSSSSSNASNSSSDSTPVATRSQSPDENNAGPTECPICCENQTDMNAPCCLTKVCATCWEDSLRATAAAGWGGHARQCPFCKAQESSWLNG